MTSPGGNATGLRLLGDTALVDTQFWLLSKVVPRVSRIGLLQNPLNPNFAATLQSALKAAEIEACDRREIETAFRTLIRERVQAVKVSASGRFFLERALIAAVALEHRLPTCFLYREHVEAGGLMSYGESLSDLYRRAATVADKLFKGAKPGDLPLDYPRRLHMTINRKTAVALGLTIPSQTYMLVDEMIE
jgi:putative ABC transport system substrate-binding protein